MCPYGRGGSSPLLRTMKKNFIYLISVCVLLVIVIVVFFINLGYFSDKKIIENSLPVVSQASSTETVVETVPVNTARPKPYPDVFMERESVKHYSNIVGYLFGGAFIISLPDWFGDNWGSDNSNSFTQMVFFPKVEVKDRDFSDIVFLVATTTETFNAATLYESDKNGYGNKSFTAQRSANNKDIVFTFDQNIENSKTTEKQNIIIAEVFFNTSEDTRIYHISTKTYSKINDMFYIDGLNKTAVITFSADEGSYGNYAAKIREFVQGLGSGALPQG